MHVPIAAFDVRASFELQACGRFDPTATLTGDALVKTYIDRSGRLARHTLTRVAGGLEIDVAVEGEPIAAPRGKRAIAVDADPAARWPRELAVDDGHATFATAHPQLAQLARDTPGLRLVRVPWLFDIAASFILQQRVTFADAARPFRKIAERWGLRGALGLAFPDARRLADVTLYQLQALDIDARRARTLLALAREEVFRGFLHDGTPRAQLRTYLGAVSGIGPWTTEMILGFGAGDPDAVPTGDLHLPSTVCKALAGEVRGTDARMLELLEPFRGQRFRVIRLIA